MLKGQGRKGSSNPECAATEATAHVPPQKQLHMCHHRSNCACAATEATAHVPPQKQLHMCHHRSNCACATTEATAHVPPQKQLHMCLHRSNCACATTEATAHVPQQYSNSYSLLYTIFTKQTYAMYITSVCPFANSNSGVSLTDFSKI